MPLQLGSSPGRINGRVSPTFCALFRRLVFVQVAVALRLLQSLINVKMTARNADWPSARPTMHIDLTALGAMRTRDDDECSSPIYPCDSGVDDTCPSDMDTNDESVKHAQHNTSSHGASGAAPSGFRKDNTYGGFSHEKFGTNMTHVGTLHQTKTARIDLNLKQPPNAHRSNCFNGLKKRQVYYASNGVMSGNSRTDVSALRRQSLSSQRDVISEGRDGVGTHRKAEPLQWMDFKASAPESDARTLSGLTNDSAAVKSRGSHSLDSVIRSDDRSLVEKQLKRRRSKEVEGGNVLKSIMNTVSVAQSFNRVDWRLLQQLSDAHGHSPVGDFFSIYSWSTRKQLYETHPLTAYVKENTNITSELLRRDLQIDRVSGDVTRAETRHQTTTHRSQSGPTGGKLLYGGYSFKKEKTKTPGELAIDVAREKNAKLLRTGAPHEGAVNSASSTSRSVQLPDIHLPRATNSTSDSLFRRFIPGKTIKSQNGGQKLPSERKMSFDCPIQVKTFSSLPATNSPSSPAYRYSRQAATSVVASVNSSLDTSLPLLRLASNSLVRVESPPTDLQSTLNTSALLPVPRRTELSAPPAAAAENHAQLALTYQSRYRQTTPPKPPPATPVSALVLNLRHINSDSLRHRDYAAAAEMMPPPPPPRQNSRCSSPVTFVSCRQVSRDATFVDDDHHVDGSGDERRTCSSPVSSLSSV